MADNDLPSQIMSKRIGGGQTELRFPGCTPNWIALSVRGVCCEHVLQELPGGAPVGPFDELFHCELASAVDVDEQMQLSLGGLNCGDVDMEEADWIAPELLTPRL